MSETTTAHARASGRLTVGDYVGHAAGEAAQAVRRAGLRPGLDRSLGHDPALAGRVVGQEPEPGSALGRNGLVTLFVAAPGPVPDIDADSAPEGVAQPTRSARSGERRRRATRRVSVGAPEASDVTTAEPDSPATDSADPLEDDEWAATDEPVTERLDEGLLARANELFAARAAGVGRARWLNRARARALGMHAHIRRRSLLVRAAIAAIALWVVIGIAAAFSGHRVATHRAAPVARGTARPPAVAHASTSPPPERATDHVARAGHRSARRQPRAQARQPERVRVLTVVVPAPDRSVAAPAPSPPAAPAPAPPPAADPEQIGGGPFSP